MRTVPYSLHIAAQDCTRFPSFTRCATWAVLILALSVGCITLPFHATHAAQPDSTQEKATAAISLPLAPRLSYLVDPSRTVTIQALQDETQQFTYTPFAGGLPHINQGAIWLRFGLKPEECSEITPCRLILGGTLAGTTRLFVPQKSGGGNSIDYLSIEDAGENIFFSLPASVYTQAPIFIRLDADPGLWFNPSLEADAGEPSYAAPPLFLISLLAASMLMLFLRGLHEFSQWRVWAGLLTAVGLFQSMFPALPMAPGTNIYMGTAALMAPGFMLMIMPHMGRHLLNTPAKSHLIDRILYLFPLIGAVLALLPLLPNCSLLVPYLPFWPVLSLILLPLAISLFSRNIPGSLAYCAICLMPLVGAAASFFELQHNSMMKLGAQGALWGVGIGALALALTPATGKSKKTNAQADKSFEEIQQEAQLFLYENKPEKPQSPVAENEAEHSSSTDQNHSFPFEDAATPTAMESLTALADEDTRDNEKESALPDTPPVTNAASMPAAQEPRSEAHTPGITFQPLPPPVVAEEESPADTTTHPLGAVQAEQPEPVVVAEQTPKEAVVPPAALLQKTDERPVRFISLTDDDYTEDPVAALESPVTIPGDPAIQLQQPANITKAVPVEPLRPLQREPITLTYKDTLRTMRSTEVTDVTGTQAGATSSLRFDLQEMIRDIYVRISPRAEEKNLGLSWFISPRLGSIYEGDAPQLHAILLQLLNDAVDSSPKGNVQLMVRRPPESPSLGYLVFSITCTSNSLDNAPDIMTNIARAWTFAEQQGGYFSMEHTPQGGGVLFFSVNFTAVTGSEVKATSHVRSTPQPEQVPAPQIQPILAPDEYVQAPPQALDNQASGMPVPTTEDWMAERIIVADMAMRSRRHCMQMLSSLPHIRLEARDAQDAVRQYAHSPSGIIIFDADMPEEDITSAIATIRQLEEVNFLPKAAILALISHELQGERLLQAGCTEVLLKPITPEPLQALVKRLCNGSPSIEAEEIEPERAATTEMQDNLQSLPQLEPEKQIAPESAVQSPELPLPAFQPLSREVLEQQASDVPDVQEPTPAQVGSNVQKAEQEENVLPKVTQTIDSTTVTSEVQSPPPATNRPVPLLDMIVTEEEEEHTAEATPAAKTEVSSDMGDRQAPDSLQEAQPTAPKPQNPVTIRVRKNKPHPEEASPAPKTQQVESKDTHPVEEKAPLAATPPSITPETGDKPPTDTQQITARSGKVTLIGVNDSVNADLITLIPGLLYTLSDAINDAVQGKKDQSALMVEQSAGLIAGKAEIFGLIVLERMARCVERAAAAGDLEAVNDLLVELETLTEKYKEALRLCHQNAVQTGD